MTEHHPIAAVTTSGGLSLPRSSLTGVETSAGASASASFYSPVLSVTDDIPCHCTGQLPASQSPNSDNAGGGAFPLQALAERHERLTKSYEDAPHGYKRVTHRHLATALHERMRAELDLGK